MGGAPKDRKVRKVGWVRKSNTPGGQPKSGVSRAKGGTLRPWKRMLQVRGQKQKGAQKSRLVRREEDPPADRKRGSAGQRLVNGAW